MKNVTARKLSRMLICLAVVAMIFSLATVVCFAEEVISPAPDAAEEEQPSIFSEIIKGLFSGTSIALIGAALAVVLPCIGSAKGVGMVGEAASGLLSEDPSLFGKALILQALPMTQGVYGMVTAFLIVFRIGLFSDSDFIANMTIIQGAYFLMASLPIAIAGYYSAIRQARVSLTGISLLSKRPAESGKAVTSAALVETYAIFSLLISLLLVLFSPFAA